MTTRNESILSVIQNLLHHVPSEWATLTTHRLDIYDESQAKVEFIDKLVELIETDNVCAQTLSQLPTAFDYVRLGHQLSSVLEWAIAQYVGIGHEQVISFASKTMPILSILRSTTCHQRSVVVYHDCALPAQLGMAELQAIYGYQCTTQLVQDIAEVPVDTTRTAIFVTDASLLNMVISKSVDFVVNLSSDFGSILVATPREREITKWISELQHVRRRECIATTPYYALRMLQEFIGQTPEALEMVTEREWQSIADAIALNSGSIVKPLVASSGLSAQYAIMMGLLDHARTHHPGKAIQFLIPPNCYGGTNDQARRVATMAQDVSIVDVPVDGGYRMTDSLEKRLEEAAQIDAVPYILVEIPTNPRVEVPDMEHLRAVLTKTRFTSTGDTALQPIFIVDQTFCPNVSLLRDDSILAHVQTLSYVSGSKFPSGGRCTGGYVTANKRGAHVMDSIEKHLYICDNQATPLQMRILAESLPSMQKRIQQAYKITDQFVAHIRQILPNTKISFIDTELVQMGFTPSVFSLDLPSKGGTPAEKEEHKRLLNLRLINHMITNFPEGNKHCVSYGQLQKTYWTVPATSTQGTTKESDKDYIVRIAMPPSIDMDRLLEHFDAFCSIENLASF